jgi:plastocyanin
LFTGASVNEVLRPIWSLLYEAGVDVVLNGDRHYYEQWKQIDPHGRVDPGRGIRQFIVGTGGASHGVLKASAPGVVTGQDRAFGVLELVLLARSYEWRWVTAPGQPAGFQDAGAPSRRLRVATRRFGTDTLCCDDPSRADRRGTLGPIGRSSPRWRMPEGGIMRRTRAVTARAATIGLVLAWTTWIPATAGASGGGGCGADVTDRSGTTVDIQNFCFSPTVLRAEPGQRITFSNLDATGHTVLGANGSWGSFDLLHARTGTVSYRFVRPGVYAYVCTYHPGMVGTIVVGNATGPGEAGVTTTKNGPVTVVLGDAAPLANQTNSNPSHAVARGGSLGAWPAAALVASGLLLVALATIAGQRRSLRRSRSSS